MQMMPICFINAKILKSLNPNKQWTSKYSYLVELCFKLPADYNKDWLIAILEGHFENVSMQVTWCGTSHVCKVVKSVMSRPERNNFALPVWLLPQFTKEKNFFPFWYRPLFRDYELRSEKLNNEGWIIERRRIGSLYSESQVICTPFQTAVKKIYSHNLFFLTIIESYTYRDMFSPCRKVLDFRFCPVYITVTSGPSVLEWVWPGAKYCRGLWEVAIWFRERNSSFTFRKCTRIISFFIIFFFLRRLVKSTKEDFLLQ